MIWICSGYAQHMRYAQDMREADQEFVRSAMQKIEEETCLRFNEQEGVFPHSHLDVFFSASISEFKKNNIWSTTFAIQASCVLSHSHPWCRQF